MSFVIVRAAGGGGGGGGGGEVAANNAHGAISGLSPSAVTTLCSMPIFGWKYRGFTANGDRMAEVWLDVDGTAIDGQSARLTQAKVPSIILPNPWQLAGTTASIKVRNIDSGAGSFEATLLGE